MAVIEINSRDQKVYKLSTILDSSDSVLWIWFRDGSSLNKLNSEQSEFLNNLEEWFTIEACENRVKEFNNLKKSKTFTNIDEITKLIQKTLNRPSFTFSDIIWWKYEDILIAKIVEFYNFISMMMKKEDLATLFFSLCSSSEFREKQLSARTINANNHQCIWFKFDWPSDQPNSYKEGFHSTGDIFHTFVHEFCHALVYYLASISSDSSTKSTFNIKDIFYGNKYKNCKNLRDDIDLANWNTLKTFETDAILNSYIEHMDSIYYQFNGTSISNITYSRLVNMIAVPSSYAWSSMDEELICEAFAYWYLTLESECNYYWSWMHDFFSYTLWEKWYNSSNS